MVSCAGFISSTECELFYNNLFNMKLLILALLLAFMIAAFIYSKSIDPDQDMHNLFKHYALKWLPPIYILSLPFLLLTLSTDVSLSQFLILVSSVYFIGVAIVFGLIFSIIPRFMLSYFGTKENEITRTNMKHNKTNRKYG